MLTSYLHISTVNFSVQYETYEWAHRNTHCCFAHLTANRHHFLRNRCQCPLVYPKFHLGHPVVFVFPPSTWCNSPLWAMASTLSRHHDHTQDMPHSVGHLWTSEQPDETSTWQHSCVCVYLQVSYQSPSTHLGVLVVISDCLVISPKVERREWFAGLKTDLHSGVADRSVQNYSSYEYFWTFRMSVLPSSTPWLWKWRLRNPSKVQEIPAVSIAPQ
jgi:hypothetical protein